ncbi:cyclase family protein [Echinicola jeungdonensis]|uniref:Cyclase family protein n=1 Tax=Echinicola jeungdonensis TaxID=709343 RepID=A0ABV5J7C9_9BACT|nr:cyclase family protein [Echinicola jeungdonensis]MDN3669107.1 cyclase family protein [Echinicola jeungdonensis]
MKYLLSSLILLIVSFFSCSPKQEKVEKVEMEIDFPMGKLIDLTYEFSEETVYWVTSKEFELEEVAKGQTEKGYFYSAYNFSGAEHGGTHIDAPIHFAENGQSVDEIPLENLMGKAIKIDVSEKASQNPDYQVSQFDLEFWEAEHDQIPDGSIILLQTGFGKKYPDKMEYLGTDQRGPEAVKDLHFPGLAPDAAKWLVEERNIHAIGIDTPSIDYGQSQNFGTHVALMTANIPAFENVANLEKLPAKDFHIIALPMKIKGGSGGPLRIVAIVE